MLQTLRLVVGSMMSALVVLAVMMSFVYPGPPDAVPSSGLLAAVAGLAVLLFVVIEAVGYRATAPAGTPATAAGVFQTGTFLRAALGESVALVALALGFVVEEGGLVLYLTGAVLGLLLMGYHAYPWRRPIDRTEEALRRADLPLDLREQLGLRTGPIQEL